MHQLRISRGRCLPLGATALAEGVNFAMLSRHALEVWLVVSQLDSDELITEVKLDRRKNKTGDHWHVQIGGLPPTFCYGWRVDGPREKLNRFDPSLVLLDPSATALTGGGVWGVSI
jgi:isoamylase